MTIAITEKCFAAFDQSGCVVYLTWYRPLLFFWEFSSTFLLWYDFKILGTGLSIDNILRLDSFDAKINSKHAVKKVLELPEK